MNKVTKATLSEGHHKITKLKQIQVKCRNLYKYEFVTVSNGIFLYMGDFPVQRSQVCDLGKLGILVAFLFLLSLISTNL